MFRNKSIWPLSTTNANKSTKKSREIVLDKHAHGMDNKSIMEAVGHTPPCVIYKWWRTHRLPRIMEQLIASDPDKFILPGKHHRYNYVDTQRESAEIREQELLK